MGDSVEFGDLELYLTGHLRNSLQRDDVVVSNRFLDPMQKPFLVVVRSDGGPSALVTSDEAVGVTVVGPGDDDTGERTSELARRVSTIVRYCWRDFTGPVCDVLDMSGPTRIPDSERPERYLTATLRVVGREVS